MFELPIFSESASTKNGTTAEAPPPGDGFDTTISKAPPWARSLASKGSSIEVDVITEAVRGVELTSTIELATKPVPVMVTVEAALPDITVDGEIEMLLGCGFITLRFMPSDVPPPGGGVNTVIFKVPPWEMSEGESVT